MSVGRRSSSPNGFTPSTFSLKTSQHVGAGQRERLERLARYATRVVVGAGAVRSSERGRVVVETPADPKSGSTVLELDALEFVHAVCQQIPDRGMHLVRYYGAYANRTRRRVARARAQLAGSSPEPETVSASTRTPPARPGSVEAIRRQAWARLIKKVFEVDPLVCPRCGAEMVVVAWIHEPAAIDRIHGPTCHGGECEAPVSKWSEDTSRNALRRQRKSTKSVLTQYS